MEDRGPTLKIGEVAALAGVSGFGYFDPADYEQEARDRWGATGAYEAAERARLLIDGWFYPCSKAMHAELGRMYVADPRFAANYDKEIEQI
jgi:hypothetical protein